MPLSVAIRSFPSIEEAHPAFVKLQEHNINSKVEKVPGQWCYTLYVQKSDEQHARNLLAGFGFDPVVDIPHSQIDESLKQSAASPSLSENELDEIRRAMRTEKKSLLHKLALFVLSLFLFSLFRKSPELMLLIILVLLIHEAGHWLGMKIFGYKDIQMFFIPGFGAAVSGTETTPCAKQKAIVTLMGPLPGIIIGIGCVIAYFVTHIQLLSQAASAFILINGFNLLPFSPLDGGRFLEAVLFSRHPKVEIIFRTLAGLGLLAMAFLWKSVGLGVIACLTIMSLKQIWVVIRIATTLRKEIPTASAFTADEIPRCFLKQIVGELQKSLSAARRTTKNFASSAKMIWIRAITRPCPVKATVGLSLLYLLFAIPTLGLFTLACTHTKAFPKKTAPIEQAPGTQIKASTNICIDSSIKWKPIDTDRNRYPWGYSKPSSN